jgi:Flp pilus assembly protein TadG
MLAFIKTAAGKSGRGQFISSRSIPLHGFMHRFKRDRRGSVAIIFGLTIFVVFTLVGASVDYGRALLARERLQATVDSAVLAAARIWQTEQDMDLAEEKAIAHFEAMKPEGVDAKLTHLAPDAEQNTLTITATAEVTAPFLSLALNGEALKVSAKAQARFCVGCSPGGSSTGSGGDGGYGSNDGYDIEVAMMLDITGSMAGSKIEDLKEAAKDLVRILVWNDQSEHTSRVAIVPFSHAVNAGKTLGKAITLSPADKVRFEFRDGRKRDWYRPKASRGSDPYEYCVSERQGSQAYTDATPTGNARLPVVYYSSSSISNCKPAAEVMPLTNDKQALTDLIDSNDFKAEGFTAGNLGTAWAWYMLSPTWWSDISSSIYPDGRPAAYPSLPGSCSDWETCPPAERTGAVRKYAVLMTDGEYNMQFCDGDSNATGASIPDRNAGPGKSEKGDCTSPLGSSNTQALALCTAMKKAGIVVYTVGFGLGASGTQVDLLRNCATSDGHFSKPGKLFYNTQTGAELRSAFRHIATSIANIYVSQ